MSLFSEFFLTKKKQIHEFTKTMRVMHVKDGVAIPTLKKGMFMLLDGKIRVRTHWKLKDGQSLLQKQYLAYIFEQQGLNTKQHDLRAAIHEFKECRCDSDDECESSTDSESEESETKINAQKLLSGLVAQNILIEQPTEKCKKKKKRINIALKLRRYFFEQKLKEVFESNVYIKKLSKQQQRPFSFAEHTTHSSGQLQRMLLGEGQQQLEEEKAYSCRVSIRLMEQELKKLEAITRYPNAEGFGEGIAEPGFSFHQALLSGIVAHQYLLHYDFIAVGDVTLAYMNQRDSFNAI